MSEIIEGEIVGYEYVSPLFGEGDPVAVYQITMTDRRRKRYTVAILTEVGHVGMQGWFRTKAAAVRACERHYREWQWESRQRVADAMMKETTT